MSSFYKGERLLRQFMYKQIIPTGRRVRSFVPSETTSKNVRKVRVPKMADGYGKWLVDLVANQENVLLKKREDFQTSKEER